MCIVWGKLAMCDGDGANVSLFFTLLNTSPGILNKLLYQFELSLSMDPVHIMSKQHPISVRFNELNVETKLQIGKFALQKRAKKNPV